MQAHNRAVITQKVKQQALLSGFDFCGISKAEFLEEEAPRLESWLKNGFQGSMDYMNNHFDKRLDPSLLLPGARSVISLMVNYYPAPAQPSDSGLYKIARYARGEDYHRVVKDHLYDLVAKLQETIGKFDFRVFVDSAPVLERAWARKSGLGWIGKNSMLIHRGAGSYYFLAQIISDLDLEADDPVTEHCGTCTACLDACPTQAILPGRTIDSNRCISYLTIELRDEIPDEFHGKTDHWIFGCDVCQEVCPWNRFAKPHQEGRFNARPELLAMTDTDWEDLTEEVYQKVFKHSAVKRTKFSGLTRNIRAARGKQD